MTENLAYGPSYDLEVIGQEVRSEEERLLVDGPLVPSLRRTVNGCYDNVQQHLPDSFTALLQVRSSDASRFSTVMIDSFMTVFSLW